MCCLTKDEMLSAAPADQRHPATSGASTQTEARVEGSGLLHASVRKGHLTDLHAALEPKQRDTCSCGKLALRTVSVSRLLTSRDDLPERGPLRHVTISAPHHMLDSIGSHAN